MAASSITDRQAVKAQIIADLFSNLYGDRSKGTINSVYVEKGAVSLTTKLRLDKCGVMADYILEISSK